MAEQWKVGNVVRLKSGGPAMTIVEDERLLKLVWFEGSDMRQGYLPHDAIGPQYVEVVKPNYAIATHDHVCGHCNTATTHKCLDDDSIRICMRCGWVWHRESEKYFP